MALRNAFEDLAQEHTNSDGSAHLISGNAQRWRREFNALDEVNEWDVVRGAGSSVSASGGVLVITPGTTVNALTTLTSKRKFTVPLRAQISIGISSKVVNQDCFLEMVAVNEDDTIDEEVVAAWRITANAPSSTTATTAVYEVRNGGVSRLSTNATVPTVVNTTVPICMLELELETDEVWFHARVLDSTAGRSNSYVRQTTAPDPTREYKLRVRVLNGATAPAATTIRIGHVVISDYTEIVAELSGGRGSSAAGQALPVVVTNAPGVQAYMSSTGSSTVLTAKVRSLAGTNSTVVAAAVSSRRVQGFELANTSAAWRYVKLFNMATAPVVGTSVPLVTLAIPPGGRAGLDFPFGGLAFASGIGYSITGSPEDADTTPVGLNDIVGTLLYS